MDTESHHPKLTRDEFERVVEEALRHIPAEFREKMENVAVYVEDYPNRELQNKFGKFNLMGVFIGVPLTHQYWEHAYETHRVILFQKNLESHSNSLEELQREIIITVIHEVGHFFGLDEVTLRRLQNLPPE